jgi:ketosteroid isomerase-like protein
VARAFLAAYNAIDLEALADLFAADVELVHLNRPIARKGRGDVLDMFRASADPDGPLQSRRFNPPERLIVAGDVVAVEHVWEADAKEDVPSLGAKAGERARLELVSILTVADGKIARYDEYG